MYQRNATDLDNTVYTIKTNVVKEITYNDYTSYTMYVETQQVDGNVFYNITLEDKNGVESVFVTKYSPTQQWLENKNQAFDGQISSKRATDLENPFEGISGSGTNGGFDPFIDNCNGTVVSTTTFIPYPCTCLGHMPDAAGACTCGSQPGFYPETTYECIPTDPIDPNADPGGSSTSNGTGNAGSNPPDNDPYTGEEEDAMTSLITEDEVNNIIQSDP